MKNEAESLQEQVTLAWRDNGGRQLIGDGPSLLRNGVDKEHGHDVFLMVKVAVSINVAKIPDLAQLILAKPCLDQHIPGRLRVKETSARTQRFEILQKTCGRILQRPSLWMVRC